jgi:hypothetical protein
MDIFDPSIPNPKAAPDKVSIATILRTLQNPRPRATMDSGKKKRFITDLCDRRLTKNRDKSHHFHVSSIDFLSLFWRSIFLMNCDLRTKLVRLLGKYVVQQLSPRTPEAPIT